MRIAAGLLRGAINLLLTAYYAILAALTRLTQPHDQSTAKPVTYYEPEFEDNSPEMDYSLPHSLIEHHNQDEADDR